MNIGFSKPKKFLIGSFLISLWMNRPYSHVYIRFGEYMFHAAHGSVHFSNKEQFLETNEFTKEYDIKTDKEFEIIEKCRQLVGIEYGYIELLKNIINDVFYNLGFKVQLPNSKGYICSELVGHILEDLDIKFDKPKHLLTPADIDNKLKDIYG